jgi:hypothetical protein
MRATQNSSPLLTSAVLTVFVCNAFDQFDCFWYLLSQPDGYSSAGVLPNIPLHYNQLRSALAILQQQLDTLLNGSKQDQVQGSLLAAAMCIVIQKCWNKEAAATAQATHHALDKATTNASRAAHFVSKATAHAAQVLLSAANGTNTLPDIQWERFPAVLQQHLLQLFQQHGWVSSLGSPALKQQLPYERPMGLQQYHSFITSNPYYVAHWDEDYWNPQITPTPAQHPWLHPDELQEALTEDQVLTMSAQVPAFKAVLQAAIDASILPAQLLQEAHTAAAKAPLSTAELLLQSWMQQAGSAVSVAAQKLLGQGLSHAGRIRRKSTALVRLRTRRARFNAEGACAEDRGNGSGGHWRKVLTAVGSGDEGSRLGRSVQVLPYGDVQQQGAEMAGGAEGLADASELNLEALPGPHPSIDP